MEKYWRLEKEEEDQIQWFNTKNETSLFVYKQDYESGKKSEWFVEHATSKKTLFESHPKKTKEQALRLAKIYMRNN